MLEEISGIFEEAGMRFRVSSGSLENGELNSLELEVEDTIPNILLLLRGKLPGDSINLFSNYAKATTTVSVLRLA